MKAEVILTQFLLLSFIFVLLFRLRLLKVCGVYFSWAMFLDNHVLEACMHVILTHRQLSR